MTTPLTDLTILAERYQAIAKRTPAKYRPAVQAVAALLDTAADFAHSLAAHQILSRPYVDLGIDGPSIVAAAQAPAEPPKPIVVYSDWGRMYKTISNAAIIDYLREHPGATARQIVQALGIKYPTLMWRLNQLRQRNFVKTVPTGGRGQQLSFYAVQAPPVHRSEVTHNYIAPEPLPDLPKNQEITVDDGDILRLLRQRPGLLAEDLANQFATGKTAMRKRVTRLCAEGRLRRVGIRPARYYAAEEVIS